MLSPPFLNSAHSLLGRSSRGIGLELVRQLLASPQNLVVATCRTPDTATALHALKDSAKGTLHVLKLDTSDKNSMDGVVGPLSEVLGEQGLDYLVNNAAIVRTHPARCRIRRQADCAMCTFTEPRGRQSVQL